jgi:hypothetical protein
MARTATVTKDTLGLLAMGSIIVNLAQGKAYGNLHEAHAQLADWYNRLTKQYGFICREYQTLRQVNDGLQKQAREYERIIDKLRAEKSALERNLVAQKGA